MTTHCYQINPDLNLLLIELEDAVTMTQSPDEKIWIDVQGADTSDRESLLDKLQVNHLARHLCLETGERPGFYPLNSCILLVIPIKAPPEHSNKVEHITVLCTQTFLLTIRDQRHSRIEQIVRESTDWLQNRSIAALTSAAMMILSLDLLQQITDLQEQVSKLQSRLEMTPDNMGNEISDQRSRMLLMEAVVIGQLSSFHALLALDKSFFRIENAGDYLAIALANVQSAERSLQWLDGRVELMRSDVEMRSQDKVNSRLARLTILSTIFMPITFLAGIWGMNFEYMPELGSPLGYWMALGLMASISAGMFFYFRWKNWFT